MSKIKLIVLILFCNILTNIAAQKVDLGLELGMAVTPVGNNDLKQNYRMGIHSGLRSQIQVKNKLFLTTGLSITQKSKFKKTVDLSSLSDELSGLLNLIPGGGIGFDLDSFTQSFGISTDVITTNRIAITTNHIQLPLLATYQVKKIQFHLGGYASLLLTANQKIEKTKDIPILQVVDIATFDSTGLLSFFLPEGKTISYEENKNSDNIKKYDIGAIIGLSYYVDRINFGIFYSYGLVDYEDNISKSAIENHKSLRFSLSYLVNFKKENDQIILQ